MAHVRTFHQKFLDYLCHLALEPAANEYAFDASEVTASELQEMYGDQLFFLTANDWQHMARHLNNRNNWVVRREEEIGGGNARSSVMLLDGVNSSSSSSVSSNGFGVNNEQKQARDEAYADLVYRLSQLPTVDLVRKRLGRQAAEEYRSYREHMEIHSVVPLTGIEVKSRISFSKLKELVHLVTFACMNSRESAIDAFLQYTNRRRDSVRARKRALRETNKPLVQKAKALKIWFPYKTDAKKWLSDAQVATLYRELLKAIEKIRVILQPYKRFVQYVQRRRYSKRSVKDIVQNLDQMRQYIATPSLLHQILDKSHTL